MLLGDNTLYTDPDEIRFSDSGPTAVLHTTPADRLPLPDGSVDLVVTSPPYWGKRDYGFDGQIGREGTPDEYVRSIVRCADEWRRVLTMTGSVFLNLGDGYRKKSLVNVPARVELALADAGWVVRNRIVWTKVGGVPEPARDRLACRHEVVLHLTRVRSGYYYDRRAYCDHLGVTAAPGDVWEIPLERSRSRHLAPFPQELVRRAVLLSCPVAVCDVCGRPLMRVERRSAGLDPRRPQARRAMELFERGGLGPEHLDAIRRFGISDAGKAMEVQTGTGRSSDRTTELAAEAKAVLGGYFREFTCAGWETVGWEGCDHGSWRRGRVLDPFVGTGTTLRVALDMGRDSVGSDLAPMIDGDLLDRVCVE